MAGNRSLKLLATSRSANHMTEDPRFLGAFGILIKLRRKLFYDSPLLTNICVMKCLSGPLIYLSALTTAVVALWPQPRSLMTGTTALRLSSDFSISPSFSSPPTDLISAISRTESFLRDDKLQRLVVGRGTSDASVVKAAKELKSLTSSLSGSNKRASTESITKEAQKPLEERDESYTLQIPSDGSSAILKANTTLGLFRGLTTFSQFWYYVDGISYSLETPVVITDAPSFPYRGFMLDTARNFFPVADIKRTLDAMSWVKINTFHWHVTDSQSFPIEIPGFSDVSTAGAYSNSSIYSLSDVSDIISYAGESGIDVLIEIDTPGHSGSIVHARPEHIACYATSPWTTFAAEPPSGQLRLATPSTRNFTASLFSSIAKQFPSSLVSTGGDELNDECYVQDPQTQADLQTSGQTLEQALSTFLQIIHGALREEGKTPVVWEEMVLQHNVTLGNDTVVMVWISSENAAAITAKGFRLVHSPSDYFYLDCGAGEWLGANNNANSWCDPFKTWQKSYSFDPFANLSETEQKLVLGGQNLLWTEQSGPENLDPITWPRAATSAEIFWTGATLPDGTARNVEEALPRLHDIRYRMVQRGVNAIPLQPEWCAVRPGECDLDS